MKTLRQVAVAAGVHPATAASVLNAARGNTRVGEATRRRILAAARTLGYIRNESARRLKTGQSNAVGFIGGDLRNPFFAELTASLEEELGSRGLQLVIAHVAPGAGASFRQAVGVLQQQTMRGIVYWDESAKGRRGSAAIPFVPIGFTTQERPGVWLDLQRAIDLAVSHFDERGLRRVGFFAPRRHQESRSVLVRRQIFLEECRRRGLPSPVSATFDGESWDVTAAARGASVVLAERPAVEAWLGFNDTVTAFKSMAVPEQMPVEGLRPVRYAEACVAAMREAVGDDVDIMVDCHARPSPRMGLAFAKALEPYGLYFFEEPCWPEHVDGIAAVQQAVKTPIATGERLTSSYAFKELLEKRAASIVQPDITHCGGLTAARRIAVMAEAHGVAVAPHNPQGPVSTAASIELGLATPNYLICEAVRQDVPWRDEVVSWGFREEPKGRLVFPGGRPGLGVDVDEAVVRKHPFEQEVPRRAFGRDGSVIDW